MKHQTIKELEFNKELADVLKFIDNKSLYDWIETCGYEGVKSEIRCMIQESFIEGFEQERKKVIKNSMENNLKEQIKNEKIEEIMYEIYADKSWKELQDLYSSIGCTTWKPKMCYQNLEILSDVIKEKFGKLYDEMAEDIDKAYDH